MEGRIAHGGHRILRWNFDNIKVTMDLAENIKPVKVSDTERIDGAIAAIMALNRAIKNTSKRRGNITVYDYDNDTIIRNGETQPAKKSDRFNLKQEDFYPEEH